MHSETNKDIKDLYGGSLRVRVCGLCRKGNAILLVNHKGLGEDGFFWAPPGGGMIYGHSAQESLIREFKEETGLIIEVKEFLFVHEFLGKPLHAIELYFRVEILEGIITKGTDPEMSRDRQIIDDVKFMDWDTLKKFKNTQAHHIFSRCSSILEIFNLKGYFKFENNYIK